MYEEPKPLSEQIYDEFKDCIAHMKLPEGTELSEGAIEAEANKWRFEVFDLEKEIEELKYELKKERASLMDMTRRERELEVIKVKLENTVIKLALMV